MDELNERQKQLVKLILTQGATTAADLAQAVNVSPRTIYNDLGALKLVFKDEGLILEAIPRKGVTYQGPNAAVQHLLTAIGATDAGMPNSDKERETYLLTQLLRTNNYLSTDDLANDLFVSRKVVERNLDGVEQQLHTFGLALERKPSQGVRVLATEQQRRNILFRILNKYWGDNWLVNRNSGEWYHTTSDSSELVLPDHLVQDLMVIVRKFAAKHQLELTDYAYQSLVVHLAIALKRVEGGNAIENIDDFANTMQGNMRPEAEELAQVITSKTGISLPHDEISYIQIHLYAATGGHLTNNNRVHLNDEIETFLESQLQQFGYDKDLLAGLTVHMQSAVKRLRVQASLTNPYVEQIKQNYPQAFDESLRIADAFETRYAIKVNDDEVAYIALHVEAYLERKRTSQRQLQVALVCSTGLGSAQLLAAKIRREFPELGIAGVWSLKEFQQADLSEIDLIITTIKIEAPGVPTVVVPPIMQPADVELINKYVKQVKHERHAGHEDFFNLIHEANVLVTNAEFAWQDAVTAVGQQLIDSGFARGGVIQSALKREQLSFTSINAYAVPHADPRYINQPAIGIGVFKRPITWGDYQVHVVFFLAMTKTMTQGQIDRVFDDLYGFVDNEQAVTALTKCKDAKEVLDVLTGVICNDN